MLVLCFYVIFISVFLLVRKYFLLKILEKNYFDQVRVKFEERKEGRKEFVCIG